MAFLVVENQKWSAQSVYEAMIASPCFDPFVLVSTHVENVSGAQGGGLRTTLKDNVAFASRKGLRVKMAYDEKERRFVPLSSFSPDIVFYEQPYGLPDEHCPAKVSKFALTCYLPYGYGIYLAKNSGQRYWPGFSEYIWRTFVENEEFLRMSGNSEMLKDGSNVPTGYPKMDVMRRSESAREGGRRPTVIFAPHHSILPGHADSYGTFPWSGAWMLDMARSRPDIDWVLKPHPKLKEMLVRSGAMTPVQVDDYFHAWIEIGNAGLVLDGDYADVFMGSDALITDSGSFLVEYMLTGNPILLLRSPSSAGYSEFGERVVSSLYQARRAGEISAFVEKVVVDRQDPLRSRRLSIIPSVNRNSGRNVKDYLRSSVIGRAACT